MNQVPAIFRQSQTIRQQTKYKYADDVSLTKRPNLLQNQIAMQIQQPPRRPSHKTSKQYSNEPQASQKTFTNKKEIRKEKNRLAAQKSRDRKQWHLQFLQKENRALKEIVDCCMTCSAKTEQWRTSADIRHDLQPRSEESELPITRVRQANYESGYLRRQEDSSDNVSKFLWLCLIAAVVCLAQFGKEYSMVPSTRLALETSQTVPLVQKIEKVEKIEPAAERSLMDRESKQCMKCMENLRNMTNATANSLIPVINNSTNATNTTKNGTNSTKILFCKSKAAFFKKVYDALSSSSSKARNVGRVQVYGRSLSQFLDKQCFADSQLDENQLYSVEFTVAIMELLAESKPLRNISAE